MTWRTASTRMPSIGSQYTGVHVMNGTDWQSGQSGTTSTRTMFAGLYKSHVFCELCLSSLDQAVCLCVKRLFQHKAECVVGMRMMEI